MVQNVLTRHMSGKGWRTPCRIHTSPTWNLRKPRARRRRHRTSTVNVPKRPGETTGTEELLPGCNIILQQRSKTPEGGALGDGVGKPNGMISSRGQRFRGSTRSPT